MERISAALLLTFTAVALLWANLPFGATYAQFWSTAVELRIGGTAVELTFHDVVNEGLMAFFFFTVGLEVKREFTLGELTNTARAVVPVAAAVAGLLVPAGIFLLLNPSGENAAVWGAVISTDTAFLVGAVAVAGPKFPGRLRVFLLTLAVVDDIGALAAIAVFYTANLALVPLLVAAALLILVGLVRFLPLGRGPAYAVLSLATWVALYASGVHPTLAGVAIALLIPVFPPQRGHVERAAELAQAFRQSPSPEYAAATARSLKESISINERLQSSYGPYVSLLILPVFALANAGVRLDGETLAAAAASRLTWGIIAGLVIGKTVGITGATALIRATGIGKLAPGLTLARVGGGAALCGIGFTISLFIVGLAVEDPVLQAEARVGILAASGIAFGVGWGWFRILDRIQPASTVGRKLVRPFDPARDHFRGDPDAPLQLIEYGDFECPFCSRATGSIDEVRERLGSELVYVWRHLPLTRVHPHAEEAARASEAADRQGAFLDYARLLFRRQHRLEPEDLIGYAGELGLDVEQFRKDLQSPAVANRVADDALDAEYMDLSSTPTFFIGTARHTGPIDSATLIHELDSASDG